MLQSRIETGFRGKGVNLHENEELEREAKLAAHLVERWGTVAAVPDGEDSAGRQKLRLQRPDELVERCFAVAKLFMKTARDTGLIHKLPDLSDLNIDAEK